MEIDFDPAKDQANAAKHGVPLSAASMLEVLFTAPDRRHDYGEARFNAFGTIEGVPDVMTYTIRGGTTRPISLRRARAKEFRRHGL